MALPPVRAAPSGGWVLRGTTFSAQQIQELDMLIQSAESEIGVLLSTCNVRWCRQMISTFELEDKYGRKQFPFFTHRPTITPMKLFCGGPQALLRINQDPIVNGVNRVRLRHNNNLPAVLFSGCSGVFYSETSVANLHESSDRTNEKDNMAPPSRRWLSSYHEMRKVGRPAVPNE